MASGDLKSGSTAFSEADIESLKEKYSQEMRNQDDNPIKVCMRLVYSAAIEKEPNRRDELALELSEFLTKPDGVVNLFLTLIDFDTSSQIVTTHNQRFLAVSKIISHLPKMCLTYEEYCKNISQQLIPLLVSENNKYSLLACIIMKSMLESPHAKNGDIDKKILNPIFKSLILPEEDEKDQIIGTQHAIIAIHNLIQNHMPVGLFVEMFSNLFHILVLLNDTPSRLKLYLKQSLVSILNSLKPGAACCLLDETVFYSEKARYIYQRSFGVNDEITVKVIDPSIDGNVHEIDKHAIIAVLTSLLEDCNNELLVLEFFFHFQEIMWTAKDDSSKQISVLLIEPLLQQTIQEDESKLDLLNIIAMNSSRSLELISRTLLNYVVFLRSSRYQQDDLNSSSKLIERSMGSCLNILEVLFATTNFDGDQNLTIMRDKCLPVLEEMYELLSQNDDKDTELFNSLDSLLSRFKPSLSQSNSEDSTDCTNRRAVNEFELIMKDLNDKLVPVRVHALVRFKQMVVSNDRYTISRIPELYSLIESSLNDQEPYVFLACINLMAEMAIRKTDEILPKLMELYSRTELDIQVRINVGEVLVRLAKQLNETTPIYAQRVMETLFKGCKDNEELIRMSSLTNIGEICHNLGHSLEKYLADILCHIEQIMENDSIEVKCAATDLLRTALSGLDKTQVKPVERELKTIYDLLKRLKSRTLDDKFCLQLDLALDEIDRIARELLLPEKLTDLARNDSKGVIFPKGFVKLK